MRGSVFSLSMARVQGEESEDQRLLVYFSYVVRSILKILGNREVPVYRKWSIPRLEHSVITFSPGYTSPNRRRYCEPCRAGASC